MSSYRRPMEPWPELAPYARRIALRKAGLSLFLYDSSPDGAPPMLLVHGLGNEADTWRHVIPLLSAGHRVIAFDLPGFGRSDKPKRSYTVPFFRDVLFELQDVLSIAPAILVGHSLGAIIAQFAALSDPQRVERLVLISGSMVSRSQKVDLGTVLFLMPGLGEWLYTRLRKDSDAAYRSLEPYYSNLVGMPEKEREFLYCRVNERVWDDDQRRAFFSTFRHLPGWLARQQSTLPSRLAASHVPTLIIWGEADRINAVDGGRALAEMHSNARLVLVPGAGHNVQEENAHAVVEAILP